jgi:hypothetical protein
MKRGRLEPVCCCLKLLYFGSTFGGNLQDNGSLVITPNPKGLKGCERGDKTLRREGVGGRMISLVVVVGGRGREVVETRDVCKRTGWDLSYWDARGWWMCGKGGKEDNHKGF